MSGVFDVFLLWILTLFLQIQGGGGLCSPAKEAECGLLWRTCLNEQCGECVVEFGGECYNPNSADDLLLERLENCDPSVNAECKRSLEGFSEQLLVQLGDDGNAKSTESGVRNVQSNTNIAHQRKLSEKLSHKENYGDKKLSKNGKVKESARKRSSSSKEDPVEDSDNDDIPDVYFLIIIIACTLSGMAGIALSGYCWYKLHYGDDKLNKRDYIPAVKKESSKSTQSKNGDRSMDYKAEMYHYVHTKNQIAAMEKAKSDHLSSCSMSNDEDDDDEDEDCTVYECPGLAPTGDMTVVNPLFSDQEVSVSDEGRVQSTHNSPTPPSGANHSPLK